jgi:hypothetical protein
LTWELDDNLWRLTLWSFHYDDCRSLWWIGRQNLIWLAAAWLLTIWWESHHELVWSSRLLRRNELNGCTWGWQWDGVWFIWTTWTESSWFTWS